MRNDKLEIMNKIPSFTINHNKLLRGIYVSRKDEIGNEVVTTFDIRMKVPNQEPCLHNGAIHTIEHLAATYLRNDEEWKDRIVYWGPMGCLTGNYLIIKGDLESKDIVELMKRTFKFIADFEGEIPGQAAKDCGKPEGDFSIEEVQLALQYGYVSVSLGTSRLRTETAGLMAVAMANLARRI